MSRCTHTFSTLPVSRGTYEEIAQLLRTAGYDHVFLAGGEIDMMGIALVCADGETLPLAARRGALAYVHGHKLTNCPYPAGPLRETWEEHWTRAQDEDHQSPVHDNYREHGYFDRGDAPG